MAESHGQHAGERAESLSRRNTIPYNTQPTDFSMLSSQAADIKLSLFEQQIVERNTMLRDYFCDVDVIACMPARAQGKRNYTLFSSWLLPGSHFSLS
jgi:hypothetical protein